MRNYIILNGISSNTISGLLISTLPSISKPKQRTTVEEIDGRDGDIVTKLGYSAYDKEIQIGLYGDFDIDDVMTFFNGEGTVTFSNEEDKYYNYQILDQIDYEKLIRFKKANVKMHVQPFKYPLEETPVEITNQYVNNEAEEIDLDNTKEAPMTIALKGNTYQEGTPTPENPQDVHVVSGDNEISITGKNLIDTIEDNRGINSSGVISGVDTHYLGISDYVSCKPSTTYTITFEHDISTLSLYIGYKDKDGNFINRVSSSSRTFNTPNNAYYMFVYVYKDDRFTTAGGYVQLEYGSTATSYEPYKEQKYPINLGIENLLETKIATETKNGVTITHNEDGSYTLNGTATAGFAFESAKYSQTFKAGTYILGSSATLPSGLFYSLLEANTYYFYTKIGIDTATHTFDENTTINNFREYMWIANGTTFDNFILKPQLEKGSKANSYSEYGTTPIELCKIGTYQDYIYKEDGSWYLHKEIGKVVLNGSESGWVNDGGSAPYKYVISDIKNPPSNAYTEVFCNNYYPIPYNDNWNNYDYLITRPQYTSTTQGVKFKNKDIGSLNDFKTWLSTHNTIVYYVLNTPTTTEITDETLIAQLNALANATSYDTKTHITQNANDKPFILNATALQRGSGEATVENEGNIYSKPTLDIEGSGTIGIYLDGNQMFSVDLSNASECIIDTASLEAYNPSTDALMNRQVTGDYSNFKLNAGDNQIQATGDITKVTISNYTRWL